MSNLIQSKGIPSENSFWDRFWFSPGCIEISVRIRAALCLITAAYFLGSFSDAGFWYSDRGPLASDRVATFLQVGGLEDAARWIVSPLFLTGSQILFQAYLVLGVIFAIAIGLGWKKESKQASIRTLAWGFGLWLLFVGWANRTMFVGGLAETLLSLALFASAFSGTQLLAFSQDPGKHWLAGFSQKLMAAQITVVGIATFMTMLAGRVWHNGIGSFALAAPAEDRTIDLTNSLLINPLVHETLSHAMLVAIPIGFVLAWRPSTNWIGRSVLLAWCVCVAVLGSHWMYAATFATMVFAICPHRCGFKQS